MAWYNNSWLKRKAVTLTGGASGAQTDYQVKLTVTWDSDMKTDFSDLRFTKLDGTTLLDAWMESHTASTSAVIWVETNTPANTVDADVYMYYGNSGAASYWDGGATFPLYDDFPGTSLDTGKWTASIQGTGTLTLPGDGTAKFALPSSTNNYIVLQSNTTFGIGHRLRTTFKTRRGIYRMASSIGFNCYLGAIYAQADLVGEIDTTVAAGNRYIYGAAVDNSAWDYGATTTYNPTDDTYYPFEVLRYVGGSKIYWDSTLIHTATSQVPADSMSAEIGVSTSSSGAAASATDSYLSLAFVSKYVVNPATYAFGSEEDKPSVGGSATWYYNLLRVRNN